MTYLSVRVWPSSVCAVRVVMGISLMVLSSY